MLALRRGLLLRPARRALLSTAAVDADAAAFDFASLVKDNDQLLPAADVTQRLLAYLQVEPKDAQRVLSAEEPRPLPFKALFAPRQVQLLTPLVRWGFQQLEGEDSKAADAVFAALQPHANMTKGAVWRQYYQRQFFLSGAPLRAYLKVFDNHQEALAARAQAAAEEKEQEGDDVDEDEEEEAADELAASARSNQVDVSSRRKNYTKQSKNIAVLADDKKWEWVPHPVASSVVKEFCFRGRFAEAIEAYTSLPLTDAVRRDLVAILQDYEQYPSLLHLYEVHRSLGSGVQPLDVAPELDAMKKVGRTEEMDTRFQELPVKEQSRADIQELMGN
ncbi:hypothetical protein PR003_g22441 [Phytophthora rubi]|uniref:Uncharacterized protein n=1 Tax=Phytophthora rubi TaxID=129364 RepID=A0A6A3K1Z9_9STRA|nr:hypothetical protein PR002_g21750 [Phytophthora rubi]KAE9001546.1 hypothetical protein PR001_g18493 [Phytophthora rubi]KAE9301756.1 hypothetical protein PR003_g22441 [Phytophthora rubi]